MNVYSNKQTNKQKKDKIFTIFQPKTTTSPTHLERVGLVVRLLADAHAILLGTALLAAVDDNGDDEKEEDNTANNRSENRNRAPATSISLR